ncbi:hypothetical protein DER44DRAFT_740973 [Fusarium oxysporum]|nr:hypothetical protein DER44DRAFT_740973 [Fusarium oxysporum]
MQYERLIHGYKLPAHLEHWNYLTVDDDAQMEDLCVHLRFDTSVGHYFLNNFALQAHAKQFEVKMQASGWDILLVSNNAMSKNLTTGFSGTNDNKTMLPQTIKQEDLPSLLQTNAMRLRQLGSTQSYLPAEARAVGGLLICDEVELQREVEFEFEQLRENQKPVKCIPLTFPGLEPALIHFVKTGHLQAGSSFVQGFEFLSRTKIGHKFGLQKSSSRLFISKEFTKSIQNNRYINNEDVVVLWSSATETAVIVIPEEAELLLATLWNATTAVMSLLTYAAPVTKSMWRFNTLTYFTLPTPPKTRQFPSWLMIEIGVLSGRLYFDYSKYESLMTWLGADRETESSGASVDDSSQSVSGVHGLIIDQPLKFLQEWLTYRRQTQDIMHTPMGYICQRKKLDNQHPFFTLATVPPDAKGTGVRCPSRAIRGKLSVIAT